MIDQKRLTGICDEGSPTIEGQISLHKEIGWNSLELRTVITKHERNTSCTYFCSCTCCINFDIRKEKLWEYENTVTWPTMH